MGSRRQPQRNVHGEHSKEIIRLLESVSGRYHINRWELFQAYIAFCALTTAVENLPVEHPEHAKRLRALGDLKARHDERTLDILAEAFEALKRATIQQGGDVMGECFMGLDLGSDWSGQFYTPYDVGYMMALMTLDIASLRETIARNGCVRVNDPAVGAGCLIVATHDVVKKTDASLCEHIHYTVTDVDHRCAEMAYTQLSLRNIPAIIVHGNSLSLEEWDHWYTPAHVLGNWDARLALRDQLVDANPAAPAA